MHKNRDLDLINRDIFQIEEELIVFLRQELDNLQKIIPGEKFKFKFNENLKQVY